MIALDITGTEIFFQSFKFFFILELETDLFPSKYLRKDIDKIYARR